jgi:PIN domain nuclease of toxin-antitoxin system
MVFLDLQYLYETGRTTEPGGTVVQDLSQRIGLRVHEEPFQHIIALALQQTWTRDPFDRIIVGQAALHQTTLVTKDRAMRKHYPHAFWS